MNESRLKQLALALKMLNRNHNLKDSLLNLGLSPQEYDAIIDLFSSKQIADYELPWDSFDQTKSNRIFNLWEKAFLSSEAQVFLLTSLYSEVISPYEFETILSQAIMQLTAYVDVEDLYELLETTVEDQDRASLFSTFYNIH